MAQELNSQQPKAYAPELFDPRVSGGVCGFSADGKTIYFVRQDSLTKRHFIYEARRKNGKWISPMLLPFSGVNNDVGGRLSPDGNTLFFTSDRPGGSQKQGDGWNIWKAERRGEGWGTPIALTKINNEGLECCAVPVDGKRIMFSADRDKEHAWWILLHDLEAKTEVYLDSLNGYGFWQWPSFLAERDVLLLNSMMRKDSKGMDDIYVSFFRNGKWAVPQNIGEPVNTEAYEDGALLTPDKRWLIYSQHDSPETPSRVMMVPWRPIYERLR